MREYELTYLVSDEVAEADLKKVTDKVAGFISGDGGKITKDESWGRRKLAYPISKQNFATYITVWFELEAVKVAQLDHELRVFPQVIRHLTTLKVQKNEVLQVTKEDIVDTEEVEKVIGEKSFEVVEGETEESRDLMAVREKDGEESEEQAKPQEKTEEIVESEKTPEEIEEEKPKKVKKTKVEKEIVETPVAEPTIEEKTEVAVDSRPNADQSRTEKKVAKPKKSDKLSDEKKSEEDEADRIKKLDEKLDELLGDDL